MSQHDYVFANQTGASLRADLNLNALAVVSQNSETTEPATMYAYMFWADTTTGILKQRNAANSAWISLWTMSTGFVTTTGTFTPVLKDAPTGNAATAAASVGIYTKIGKIYHIYIHLININTTGLTAGNQAFITDLPATSVTVTNGKQPIGTAAVSNVAFTYFPTGIIDSNTSYISLKDGASSLLVSAITSPTGDMWLNFSYEAA